MIELDFSKGNGLLPAIAQDYKTGIGIRGGTQNGLTVKHFFSEHSAIEGIVSTRWEGFYVIGLYEWHGPYFSPARGVGEAA